MVEYFCAWKDNRGVTHSTEKAAKEAEVKYEIERQAEAKRQKIIYEFRRHISGEQLPYFHYNDWGSHHYNRQAELNRDRMIDWLIKNSDMIKEVLNG